MKYPPIQGVFSWFQGKAWLDETSAWCWMEEAAFNVVQPRQWGQLESRNMSNPHVSWALVCPHPKAVHKKTTGVCIYYIILLNAVPTKIIYQHYKGFYGRSNRSKLKISRWHVTQCVFLLRFESMEWMIWFIFGTCNKHHYKLHAMNSPQAQSAPQGPWKMPLENQGAFFHL